ncbi:MAG: hypothetical protein HC862_09975 [Scytonema sp. RU_4_4]|nr:hypothetical protein [Scytonema sp. RU_4_4]
MSRDALVVGINTYEQLKSLNVSHLDAEAIAQLLEKYGEFKVKRLPAVKDKQNNTISVGQKTQVSLTQLEEAIVQLFKPEGKHIPDTALLYFSGHGLRKNRGIQEGFLATSDVNPEEGKWGLSLQWLRRLLQESDVGQQIIILDCCYSGEVLNFAEADPGDRGKGRDRCFIAASREFEVAYEGIDSKHGVLTAALLKGLEPKQERWVNNYTLVDFLNQERHVFPQRPIFANSGEPINLTRKWTVSVKESAVALEQTICPYKGLDYFDYNDEDPKYFYGRTFLTDKLLEKVRQGNFLAILGASGSGKSSVVRAGLLHQLKLGRRLSASDQWKILPIIRPGEHLLHSLAVPFIEKGLSAVDRAVQLAKAEELIAKGAEGLRQLVFATDTQRVVLVVDQFEEAFTVCRDSTERQQFFECLLGALERTDNKLCVVLVMRADFFGKCAEQEYAGLTTKIQEHQEIVMPMKPEELEQAIIEPAKQVGLEVECELVTQMIADVKGSPSSLVLLEYSLTELWKQRQDNCLRLNTYIQLGGVIGTLQKRATQVYESFPEEQQTAIRHIFLALTQLGEGTEDTRRQVLKGNLVNSRYPEGLIDEVIQRLTDEKLIVTSERDAKGSAFNRVAVVDVAHEALIRHWKLLRQWIDENRDALRKQRNIEKDAKDWQENGKPIDDFLLRGLKLSTAEDFLQRYADNLPLSDLAQEFVKASRAERDRLRKQDRVRRQRWMGVAIALGILGIAFGIQQYQFRIQQERFKKTLEAIFLDTEPEKISKALPSFLKQAKQLNSQDVDLALSYYRSILTKINKHLKNVPNIELLRKEAENSLASILEENRLKKELTDHFTDKRFGEILPNTEYKDLAKRYTEGALKTTYKILMTDFGAGADLNHDGQINNKLEAEQMPCDTLIEIEKIWRQENEKCVWHSTFDSLNCIDGKTLTALIFDYPTGTELVMERVNYCSSQIK